MPSLLFLAKVLLVATCGNGLRGCLRWTLACRRAELRVVARAGIRPRGYLVSSFASSEAAAEALSAQWGFDAQVAKVSLQARHDRWVGRVEREGEGLLHIELEDPEPVAPGDVPLVASLHLVRARTEQAEDETLIVQLDTGYEIARAERGRPKPWRGEQSLRVLQSRERSRLVGGHFRLARASPFCVRPSRLPTNFCWKWSLCRKYPQEIWAGFYLLTSTGIPIRDSPQPLDSMARILARNTNSLSSQSTTASRL